METMRFETRRTKWRIPVGEQHNWSTPALLGRIWPAPSSHLVNPGEGVKVSR